MRANAGGATVYLHIGPPKTGTTYLQELLRYWHKDLRTAGVLFPGIPRHDHFPAALDARGHVGFGQGDVHGSTRARTAGAWARLVRKVKAFDGTSVISHEVFASADAEHAAAAVRDLAGTDLHLVVTARDPGRQLVSLWQQRVKQGSTKPFRVAGKRADPARALPFAHRVPDLLDRWGSTLPEDHVHIVTVPPAGSEPELLWDRFATVVGIDSRRFAPDVLPRLNTSLGVCEIELLRRVNAALAGRLRNPEYGRVVTRVYANQVLAQVRTSPPPELPESLLPVADGIADSWVARIEKSGYHVCGDLHDLRPRRSTGVPPDAATEADVAVAAVEATAGLMLAVSRRDRPREVIHRLAREAAAGSLSSVQTATHRLRRAFGR